MRDSFSFLDILSGNRIIAVNWKIVKNKYSKFDI